MAHRTTGTPLEPGAAAVLDFRVLHACNSDGKTAALRRAMNGARLGSRPIGELSPNLRGRAGRLQVTGRSGTVFPLVFSRRVPSCGEARRKPLNVPGRLLGDGPAAGLFDRQGNRDGLLLVIGG